MARAPVPDVWLERVVRVLEPLPEVRRERAWTGVRWVVRGANVAHLFGGEDGLLRVTFRAPMDEVAAFEHLGPPYFRVGRSSDVVGLVLDDADPDLDELHELLLESYCVQAPQELVDRVEPPAP
ncbi:MAG: MmcQ/YjbR family DNA-binding protein [Aeromicrobium erythreum]